MLSSSAIIEDNDWDSVRQATSALTRDLERLMLSMGQGGGDFGGATPKSANDQQVAQDGNYGFNSVTMDMLLELEERLQAIIAAIPEPPSSYAVGGDLSGTTNNASVIKLRGTSVSTTAPSVDEQFLVYNLPLTQWEPVTVIASNGGILTKDGAGLIEIAGGTQLSVVGNETNTTGSINAIAAASADTVLGRRGTTLTWDKVSKAEMADAAGVSVVGRAANSTGVTDDITAVSDNFILGRRSGVLTWAKVERAEQADGGACSVIGRSANSSGAVADISASADGQVLQRLSGTLQFAAISGLPTVAASDEGKMLFVNSSGAWSTTRDPYLGDNPLTASSVQGSFGVVKSTDGDYIKLSSSGIEIFDRSVSTGTALIRIDIGHASLNATGRALSVREIDVCDGGVDKKMLILASAPY